MSGPRRYYPFADALCPFDDFGRGVWAEQFDKHLVRGPRSPDLFSG